MPGISHDNMVVVNPVIDPLEGPVPEGRVRKGIEDDAVFAETFDLGHENVAIWVQVSHACTWNLCRYQFMVLRIWESNLGSLRQLPV
jgi:hypothetical protein